MCLNIGTSNNHHFAYGINGKVVVLGVPILKHFRVNFTCYSPVFYSVTCILEMHCEGMTSQAFSKAKLVAFRSLDIKLYAPE